MERYLRILNEDQNSLVYKITFKILRFQLVDSNFLQYRPSQLAACAIIISLNICRK